MIGAGHVFIQIQRPIVSDAMLLLEVALIPMQLSKHIYKHQEKKHYYI